jgi:flagellar biosynthesis/type III secretory pathway protein FliH
MSGNAREFRIEADRRLRRGDCLVETEGGLIDAVLSSRLDYLVEELLKHT